MPEAVHIVPHLNLHPELLQEVPLPVEPVPHEGLPAGQVAVRLYPPSPHHLPPSLPHELPYLLEQLGIVLLHPPIGPCRTPCEGEPRMPPHHLGHLPAGREHHLPALVLGPQPHGVYVSVGYHVDGVRLPPLRHITPFSKLHLPRPPVRGEVPVPHPPEPLPLRPKKRTGNKPKKR